MTSDPTTDTIVRVAARGDGITADGRHAAFTAPGDTLAADGSVTHGPHHQTPPCVHFPTCGGCQLQHLDDESYSAFVTDRIASALEREGKYAKRVVYAIQQMFGIEFAPEVVQADGNVRNLAWRICNAKKVLAPYSMSHSKGRATPTG